MHGVLVLVCFIISCFLHVSGTIIAFFLHGSSNACWQGWRLFAESVFKGMWIPITAANTGYLTLQEAYIRPKHWQHSTQQLC